MTNEPKQSGEAVHPLIPVADEAAEALLEDAQARKLEPSVETTDELESVRKPIVIGVEPEIEEDGDRTPKNTNIETIKT